MRIVLAAALLALTGPAIVVGAGGPYGDSSCRTDRATWANDPCAGRQWPHVAGVAALVISRFGKRRATPTCVYNRLKSTADDLGVSGLDPLYGYGRVNARRAVGR